MLPSAAASLLHVPLLMGTIPHPGQEPLGRTRADGDEAEQEAARGRSAYSIAGSRLEVKHSSQAEGQGFPHP